MITVSALALTGCDLTSNQDAQYDDSRNPYYKQAQQDLDNNDPAKAALDYEAALGANPKLTEAHYQLGHLYADKLNDPIGSIFHFQQYLKLAPTGDKADEVKALIDKESQAFAASLPNSTTQNATDYAQLQADNASLKKQVDDASLTISKLQAKLAKHHLAPVAAPVPAPAPEVVATDTTNSAPSDAAAPSTNDASATPPDASTNAVAASPPRALPLDATNGMADASSPTDAAAGPSKTYKVIKGDSIWKIAHKMYPGDIVNGMEKIKDANKQIAGKPLKIGQILVIPE